MIANVVNINDHGFSDMILNHFDLKNEGVNRKMFTIEMSNTDKDTTYFISEDKQLLLKLHDELSDLYCNQLLKDLEYLCSDNNIIIVRNNSDKLPKVLTYKEFLDCSKENVHGVMNVSMNDVLFIDEYEQVHELVLVSGVFHVKSYSNEDLFIFDGSCSHVSNITQLSS